MIQYKVNSPIGAFYLVASEKGLCGLYWKKQSVPMTETLTEKTAEVLNLAKAERQLGEYFAGKRKSFDIEFDVNTGTPFQKQVWRELQKIPYGKTISYKELAAKIKNEKACRAVGTANGKNPMSIIVPCHRVVAADGTLGGYAGGLPVKTKLLEIERSK